MNKTPTQLYFSENTASVYVEFSDGNLLDVLEDEHLWFSSILQIIGWIPQPVGFNFAKHPYS